MEGGASAASSRGDLQNALSKAMELMVARHVGPEAIKSRAGELKSSFYSKPSKFISLYSVIPSLADEFGEVGDEIEVEADVDRDKLLDALRSRGFDVRRMSAFPRIAVIAKEDPLSASAVKFFKGVLEKRGFNVKVFSVEGEMEEQEASDIARDLGCHIALLFSVEEKFADNSRGGSFSLLDFEFSEKSPIIIDKPLVFAAVQVVDSSSERILGMVEAEAFGRGPDKQEALVYVAARVGKKLTEPFIALLEQSEWSPGVEAVETLIRIKGLAHPSALEEIQKELLAITEILSADLRGIGFRTALWTVTALDSGISWKAVLSSVKLSRGRLAVVDDDLGADADFAVGVNAMWLLDE